VNALVLLILAAAALLLAYLVYGRYLARKWGVGPNKATPAHEFMVAVSGVKKISEKDMPETTARVAAM
jgi:hypothetical protein